MAKGMKLPIAVTPQGGSRMLDGHPVITQNIRSALIPAGSLHPWGQNLAPSEDFSFQISDKRTSALYASHVRQTFEEMERNGFARLLPGSRGLTTQAPPTSQEGDMIVTVRYVNMETGKNQQINIPIFGDK